MGEEVKAPTNTNDRVCAAPKLRNTDELGASVRNESETKLRHIDDELDGSVRNKSVLWLVALMFVITL